MSEFELSRLRPYLGDSKEGPGTVLQIHGFTGPEEIAVFMDALLKSGVFKAPKELKQ